MFRAKGSTNPVDTSGPCLLGRAVFSQKMHRGSPENHVWEAGHGPITEFTQTSKNSGVAHLTE